MKTKQIILFSTITFFSINVFSQQVIATAGDHMSNSNGSMSWTLGEVITETFTNSTSQLTQGFHQPSLKVVSLVPDNLISITAFPNPTAEILYLQINEESLSDFLYEMYDVNGKQVMNGKIIKSTTEITFINQAPAMYFIKVLKENRCVKNIKIIKE